LPRAWSKRRAGARIALGWTASRDDETGVDLYEVYRDGARIARCVEPAYRDTHVQRLQAAFVTGWLHCAAGRA
jgi:hypothetical protein